MRRSWYSIGSRRTCTNTATRLRMASLAVALPVILALALLAATAAVLAQPAGAAPVPWNPMGSYTIAFTCTAGCVGVYPHDMDITSFDSGTGAFSGVGHYNGDLTKTWNITGTLTGSSLT